MITPLTEGRKKLSWKVGAKIYGRTFRWIADGRKFGRHIILEGYIHRAIQTLIIEDANTNTDDDVNTSADDDPECQNWWRCPSIEFFRRKDSDLVLNRYLIRKLGKIQEQIIFSTSNKKIPSDHEGCNAKKVHVHTMTESAFQQLHLL